MPAGTSSEEVGLLGTHWSSCPDVTANRVFPFPLRFPLQVLQRLDDVVLRCLPSKQNESFKKRTHMWSWRTLLWCASNQSGSQRCPAYGDLLHSCMAAHTHTDDTDNVDCFALQCLWTLHELKLKKCLEYVRVVLNSFIWKTSSSPKNCFFRRTFANSMFFFRGTCWQRFLRKTWMCDILKLFQASDPSSHFILRQLHLNIFVLL